MAKTETTVNNLKINRGTYANIQANLASIGENELIITTDKTIPIPQAADAGKVISVNSSGEYTLQPTSPSGVTSVGIINGGGLSVSGSPIISSGSITVAHADTSSQASVDNSGRTYIQDVTLDEYGHVTKLTSATETVVDTNTTYTLNVSGTGDNATKVGLVAGGSGSGTTWYTIPYATEAGSATPTSHSHGNITNDGKIGTAADKVITTSTDGLLIANSTLPVGVTQASLANLPTWTANPTDSTYLLRRDTGGSASYGQVTFSTVWSYISGKIGNITASDTTKKIYTTGTTGSGASDIANRYYDPNIYRPANNAGMLVADKFSTSESAYMTYDSTEEAIKFVFA